MAVEEYVVLPTIVTEIGPVCFGGFGQPTVPPVEAGFKSLNIDSETSQLFLKILFKNFHFPLLLLPPNDSSRLFRKFQVMNKILGFIVENTHFT